MSTEEKLRLAELRELERSKAEQAQRDAQDLQKAMQNAFAQGTPFLSADPGDENATTFHAPADLTSRPTQPAQIVLTPVDLGQLRSMMAKWERRAPLFDSSTGAIIAEILADVRSVIK